MSEYCVVFCTVPSPELAEAIARGLLEDRLAACVGVLPAIRSFYTWKGALCREDEVLLVIKTTRAAYPALEHSIRNRHPYEVPEIVRLPIEAGWPPYLDWIRDSVSPEGAGGGSGSRAPAGPPTSGC
jgi:periplasmic divalent cation tolerance protein